MAAKKKARKKKKSPKKRPAARKKVAKKARRASAAGRKKVKKSAKKAPKAKKKKAVAKPKAKSRARLVKAATSASPAIPANEERVGTVTHYFNHLGVAIIQLETGVLREGDMVHIKGHTSDFRQRVGSMEVEHVHVNETRPGQSFGLKVSDHAREHDVVYRIKNM